MSRKLAEALGASNSEDDLRRFEELMNQDVKPKESFEEFSERYSPEKSRSPESIRKSSLPECLVQNFFSPINRRESPIDMIGDELGITMAKHSNIDLSIDSLEPRLYLTDDTVDPEIFNSPSAMFNINIFMKDEDELNSSRDHRSP
ncbi:hypothetical protein [Natronocalculus amylovorans]|uniref:Uncharacterized protein n=1 Tax=Natronocalculus amylovorans TaxID=2917812 RepID=A0AAE3G005_9EURY|nr:hypothetical protein [Natronocalculus amylovorans]MCL9818340.1 hypothetical protein [Natronocalculus amylovorans]